MFQRYTEPARRTIFFARYHASEFGSSTIETEHLLLGLLREDKALKATLSDSQIQSILDEVEQRSKKVAKISTSVDLPLSPACKRVLAYAAEEADRLNHSEIECGHLVLGLLREQSLATDLLRKNGIELSGYRDTVMRTYIENRPKMAVPQVPARPFDRENEWAEQAQEPAAPSLREPITLLESLVENITEHANGFDEAYGFERLKRKPWTRKEALGHLLDWATSHHQWFVRALSEPKLIASTYPQDEWAAAQSYNDFDWQDIVDLWVGMNRLLIHVLLRIPEGRLEVQCHIGIQEPIALKALITRYVEHCADIVGQILARL